VVFSQQWCVFATGMHKYHTHPRGVTFLPHPLAHMHTGAHTYALRTHAHTYAQTHTRPSASAHTQAQPRKRVPFPLEKRKRKRITPANHPESPQRITLSTKRITPNHRKNTRQRKNFKYVFFCFQCFNIFIR
jgi:hypothetical protein